MISFYLKLSASICAMHVVNAITFQKSTMFSALTPRFGPDNTDSAAQRVWIRGCFIENYCVRGLEKWFL